MRVKLLLESFVMFIFYYEYIDQETSSYEQKMIVYLLANNKISSRFGFYQVLKYPSWSLQLLILLLSDFRLQQSKASTCIQWIIEQI